MRMPKKEGLNVIPLIDIMLVLLAIVLSISTFIAQGKIQIDLPSAQSAQQEPEKDEKKISVTIDKDNKFFVDDVEVSPDDLKDKLNAIDDKTLVQLKSDKLASFESFVKVVDILKEKGHENFAISALTE